MSRWLWTCVWCVVVAVAACGAASSAQDAQDEPDAGGSSASEPAAPPATPSDETSSPPPPARPRAADGTASVVATPDADPSPPDQPPADPLPVAPPPVGAAPVGPPPAGDRPPAPPTGTAVPTSSVSGSPGSLPPDPPTQPPPGVAETLLAGVLEPLNGRPGGSGVVAPAEALYARPLPLLEALERSGDRARRLWVTQAYWKTAHAYAVVRWSTEAIDRLELIAPGGDPHDRATLDVATAAARADLADARAQLGVAQQELVDLARLPVSEPLPWPVDRPLAGAYQTHFEAIFANRVVTGRMRAIARTLPARHEALESRAAAVRAAETAMAMAEADHAKGKRPIEAVVAAHAAVVAQQREFLQAVKVYNLEIAEYAMAVADLSVPDDRFVSMLIPAPVRWRASEAAVVGPPAAALP